MKTQTSKKSFFFRSLLLLPLLAFLVMGFSETRILPREVTVDIPMQEGATKEQVSEYNALASKYNAMMQQDDIRIEMSDVERLEYLHSLMTEEQRGSAEPFPDFPEPPPPPEAPEEIEEELIEMEREIERQAVAMEEQRNEMDNQAKVMEQEQVEMERQAELMEEQEVEMEKDAKAMEVERVEMERQAKIMEEQEVEMEKKARKMEKAFINTPQAPPPPPEPKSPLEYVQEMAKQDAIFYYKKKKITSDEAIAILKKNKDLSIDISKTNDERPIVKIDTHF